MILLAETTHAFFDIVKSWIFIRMCLCQQYWHHQDSPAFRSQYSTKFTHCSTVILDMLQYVRADDKIKTAVRVAGSHIRDIDFIHCNIRH